MDIKVFLNDGSTLKGEGNVDEMGITVRKPDTILVVNKEDQVTMTMIPWTSVKCFEYVVTKEMIAAQNAAALAQAGPNMEADLTSPNRAQRRAANRV